MLKIILIFFSIILNINAYSEAKKIDNKAIVVELIKSIEKRDPKSVEYVDKEKYKDNNAGIKYSIKGFNKVRSKNPKILR
ncbi:hypothetical protein [Fluviispira vulneris]|uniref:hypothetical protein n=1 Tax=Fluviispira vulneris TaxID=2763012 RepID=UPI0016465AC0|nr:hypothetical protein [Fluviispira vulneris]